MICYALYAQEWVRPRANFYQVCGPVEQQPLTAASAADRGGGRWGVSSVPTSESATGTAPYLSSALVTYSYLIIIYFQNALALTLEPLTVSLTVEL